MGSDGVTRLADFGVARVPDAALTGQGQFLGTPCYGAPETLSGSEAGPLSDQFAFAAVLYEAVSGTRAFPGTDALAVAHSVIHNEPRPPSRWPAGRCAVPPPLDVRDLARSQEESPGTLRPRAVLGARAAWRLLREGLISRRGPADTLPAVALGERASRARSPPAIAKKRLRLWPSAGAGGGTQAGTCGARALTLADAARSPTDATENAPCLAESARQARARRTAAYPPKAAERRRMSARGRGAIRRFAGRIGARPRLKCST